MAKKRPKVSNLGSSISRAEAENIGKRVTEPAPPTPEKKVTTQKQKPLTPVVAAKPKLKPKPASNPVVAESDPMIIVRIRKGFKKLAKTRALELDMKLYEYLEHLIQQDIKK